ncbi:helix-turn-helix domain-containing protein [Amycolatopsis rhabdoformis]|uniref:Helix-turn-helix domain-containing protein n=1 Tax=Amycolatopsis rhabdoformis TaxID=1448059 RepID=A0ABZ1I8R3_9PSEU|nr:helix-turn-helix domain-containing protein [Amycolatopsis rhabdoformis]WSE30826.1 helix-turn-helix domain-containing protein [Amycolatopsis rhabdoformis]
MTAEAARPMRADAKRNYDRIVATAKDAFGEHGIDVPLDDIAKRAGVGAGTLYRHFPTREKLMEAVYRDEIDLLASRAPVLAAELPPFAALEAWLGEQVAYVIERHGLATLLKASIDSGSETFLWCQSRLRTACGDLLAAAQATGEVRGDVTGTDVLRLGHGIGMAAKNASEEDGARLMKVMVDGLRG